jgi:hypothetical protein
MGKITKRVLAVVGVAIGIVTFRSMRKHRSDAAREEQATRQKEQATRAHERAETAREHADAAAEHARLAAEKASE